MIYLIIILAICAIFICGFILGKCYASFFWSNRIDRVKKQNEALNEQMEKLMEDIRKGKYKASDR